MRLFSLPASISKREFSSPLFPHQPEPHHLGTPSGASYRSRGPSWKQIFKPSASSRCLKFASRMTKALFQGNHPDVSWTYETEADGRVPHPKWQDRNANRTMVGIFCNRTACRIRNRRRRHDSNMNLLEEKTPRAPQHNLGWIAPRTTSLSPVAGDVFLVTIPFIERAYRICRLQLKMKCRAK